MIVLLSGGGRWIPGLVFFLAGRIRTIVSGKEPTTLAVPNNIVTTDSTATTRENVW
jgi:hypothetical protein